MTATYLFYDLETSGLHPAFDQILQFAAVRTDLSFRALERHQFYVRLSPTVVPDPKASITHRIALEDLEQHGISEIEAASKIHRLVNTPGTISCGYNSLSFDEPFLRFSFYRHLLPPYTHQYAQGCGRLDLYPVAVLYALYQRAVCQWPEREGVPTLKLEALNDANQWVEGRAHDAVVDVAILIALARCLASKPEMWQYALGYFVKRTDQKRIASLPVAFAHPHQAYGYGLYVDGSMGAKRHYQCPVLGLGPHRVYKNQTVWLRLDAPEFPAEVEDCGRLIIRKKTGEPGFLLPPKPEYLERCSVSVRAAVRANIDRCASDPDFMEALTTVQCTFTYPEVPNVDRDAALYQSGFLSDKEADWCARFHQAVSVEEKQRMVDVCASSSLQAQATRVMARYYSETPLLLSDAVRVDYRGRPYRTSMQVLADIATLSQEGTLDAEQQQLLAELKNYMMRSHCVSQKEV